MFHLFERFGVELEYMVVDRGTLAVRPVVDRLLREAAAMPGAEAPGERSEWPDEVVLGDITAGNELTAHVLEFKVSEPAPALAGLSPRFAAAAGRMNALLARHGAMLLPTGMHPTMDPDREMVLWPHGNSEVYQTFNRIFDCRGHGWANLQAAHLNLPFSGADAEDPEGEFGRLHAAVRVLLPIMPALSASTPFMDGRVTGVMDNRLEVYRTNSRKIPAAAGLVIPEAVFTRRDYERVILREIYRQFAPHDPGGVLRHEWANSRGAIARFTRGTIEVRVLDVQECPAADLAVCAAIAAVLREAAAGRLGDPGEMRRWGVEPLHAVLLRVIQEGDAARIGEAGYLKALGLGAAGELSAGEVWGALIDRCVAGKEEWEEFVPALETIRRRGCLARRIVKAVGNAPDAERVRDVYGELAGCLAGNRMFEG